jgi:hypothetical protein
MFLTYASKPGSPRTKYASQSLRSLLMQLTFRDGELAYHIADDGSPPEHIDELYGVFHDFKVQATVSQTDHLGYGGNFNLATQAIHKTTDLILPCEDDWELVRHFDLSDLAKTFNEKIRCIRLGYLGWTDIVTGELIQSAGQTFMLFDPHSPEKHIWAGHPRLETVQYEQEVGPWPEGLQAGFTELEVGGRYEARKGVVWPLDAKVNASQDYCSLFAHIGNEQA